jgi:hypothetical protein
MLRICEGYIERTWINDAEIIECIFRKGEEGYYFLISDILLSIFFNILITMENKKGFKEYLIYEISL